MDRAIIVGCDVKTQKGEPRPKRQEGVAHKIRWRIKRGSGSQDTTPTPSFPDHDDYLHTLLCKSTLAAAARWSSPQPRALFRIGHQYFSVHHGGSTPRIFHVSASSPSRLWSCVIDIPGLPGSVESEHSIRLHFPPCI